jgi:Protein of unknown function (DUF3047)
MFDLAHSVTGEAPVSAALMYVWYHKAPMESVIRSERTGRIRKVVLESGRRKLGSSGHCQRDIAADFRRSVGEGAGALIAIGLMSDWDNTRSDAKALYGEVRRVSPDGRVL